MNGKTYTVIIIILLGFIDLFANLETNLVNLILRTWFFKNLFFFLPDLEVEKLLYS